MFYNQMATEAREIVLSPAENCVFTRGHDDVSWNWGQPICIKPMGDETGSINLDTPHGNSLYIGLRIKG